MTVGMFGYVVNDALIKLAAEDLPLFESIFIRGCFITLWMFLFGAVRGELKGSAKHLDSALGLRIAMEAVGTALYLSALTRTPLAGITAVLQIVPLIVTFAAARLLREAVSWQRVASVITGFIGVMFVIRPGSDDFNPWFLVGFLVVAAIVVREFATTNISKELPTVVISLCSAILVGTMGFIGAFFEGWERPGVRTIGLLFAASILLAIGYVGSVITIRVGDLSFSAPFRYTIMVFAIILQIVIFGDVPDLFTFIGAAIIVAAGLFSLRVSAQP